MARKKNRSVLPAGFDKAAPEVDERAEYWCGVTDDCPIKDIYAGGVDFPRFTEIVSGGLGETRRERKKGAIRRLTVKQIDNIRETLSRKVIRFKKVSGQVQGEMHNTNNRAYVREESDQPAAAFVYMLPPEASALARANNEDPITLLEMELEGLDMDNVGYHYDAGKAKDNPKPATSLRIDPDAEWKRPDEGDDDHEWDAPKSDMPVEAYPGESKQPWYGKPVDELSGGEKGKRTKWLNKAKKKAEKALA